MSTFIYFLIKSVHDIDEPEQFVTNILENILSAKIQPKKGQNIFFIDTVRMKKHKKERPFTSRQACAIESSGELKCQDLFRAKIIYLHFSFDESTPEHFCDVCIPS